METQDLLPIGTPVKIVHQQGEYKIKGYNKDGSYLLYGGISGHGSFRDAFNVRQIKQKKSKRETND